MAHTLKSLEPHTAARALFSLEHVYRKFLLFFNYHLFPGFFRREIGWGELAVSILAIEIQRVSKHKTPNIKNLDESA